MNGLITLREIVHKEKHWEKQHLILTTYLERVMENGQTQYNNITVFILQLPPRRARDSRRREGFRRRRAGPRFLGHRLEIPGMLFSIILYSSDIQGDTSHCSLGSVDVKTKVAFQYKEHILKRNFCFHVNRTKGTM